MRTYKQLIQHLWQSEFIRSFAEIDPDTGKYKRDINEADKLIFYLCDGKKCGENHNCGECEHTRDIKHAKNFKYDGFNGFWEQSPTVEQPAEPATVEQQPATDPDKCPFTYKQRCPYFKQGLCGKCTYNNP